MLEEKFMLKNFKNYKISKKLWIGFGIVLGLMFISLVVSFMNLNTMGNQVNQYSKYTVPNNEYVWTIRRNLVSVQRYLLVALTESDAAAIESNLTIAGEEAAKVVELLGQYKLNARVDMTKFAELEQYIN